MRLTLLALTLLCTQDLHAESPAVVDVNGTLLGSYVGPAGPVSDDNVPSGTSFGAAFVVVSPTGYMFSVGQRTGRILATGPIPGFPPLSQVMPGGFEIRGYPTYTTPDCSGQAYAPVYGLGSGNSAAAQNARGGVVIGIYAPSNELFYADKLATPLVIVTASQMFQGVCQPTGGSQLAIPIAPNNPDVTGVMGNYAPPITLSAVPVPRAMFRDGFEDRAQFGNGGAS